MRYAAAVAAALVMTWGCAPQTQATAETETSVAEAPQVEPSKVAAPSAVALTRFAPSQTYKGLINLPSRSRVIRDEAAYVALVGELPTHVVTKGPARHNKSTDPLLAKPAVDFGKSMIVVGVCHSFYCRYEFDGYAMVGGKVVVHGRRGEPDEMAMYAQRPVRGGGRDAVGHYVALVVDRVEGEVVFQERGLTAK